MKLLKTFFYVLGMVKNLLSVGKFADSGYHSLFGPHDCWIFSGSNPHHIMYSTRTRHNNLYRLDTSITRLLQPQPTFPQTINLASTQKIQAAHLWHRRTAHLTFRSFHNLSHREMVTGIPHLPLIRSDCEACIFGKHHQHPIPKLSLTPTTRPLELVHSDLCSGPLPRSLGGPHYILTFIDAPIVKWSTIHSFAAKAANQGHQIHHLDVITTF